MYCSCTLVALDIYIKEHSTRIVQRINVQLYFNAHYSNFNELAQNQDCKLKKQTINNHL